MLVARLNNSLNEGDLEVVPSEGTSIIKSHDSVIDERWTSELSPDTFGLVADSPSMNVRATRDRTLAVASGASRGQSMGVAATGWPSQGIIQSQRDSPGAIEDYKIMLQTAVTDSDMSQFVKFA